MSQFKVGDVVMCSHPATSWTGQKCTITSIGEVFIMVTRNSDGMEGGFDLNSPQLTVLKTREELQADLEEAVAFKNNVCDLQDAKIKRLQEELRQLPRGLSVCYAVINDLSGECFSRHDNKQRAETNFHNLTQGGRINLKIIKLVECVS